MKKNIWIIGILIFMAILVTNILMTYSVASKMDTIMKVVAIVAGLLFIVASIIGNAKSE